jgi:hypothetical protein
MKTKLSKLAVAAASLLVAGTTALHAQTYSVNWSTIAGGGGTGTNGPFAVSGTIGQAAAGGPMTNGQFSVTGGFWALVSAVQTPGAPPLYITHSGSTVTVYWQNTPGWNLQQNTSVKAPANWSASSGVTTSNGTNYLSLVNPAGNLFFRLNSP